MRQLNKIVCRLGLGAVHQVITLLTTGAKKKCKLKKINKRNRWAHRWRAITKHSEQNSGEKHCEPPKRQDRHNADLVNMYLYVDTYKFPTATARVAEVN